MIELTTMSLQALLEKLHLFHLTTEKRLQYGLSALELSQKNGKQEIEAEVLNTLGDLYKASENEDKMLECYRMAAEKYKDLGRNFSGAEADKKFEYYEKSIAIAREIDSKLIMIRCYNDMSRIHKDKGEFLKAAEYCQEGLNLCEEQEPYFKAVLQLNLGIIYKEQSEYDKATENILAAVEVFEKQDQLRAIASAYSTLGNIHTLTNDYETAITYHYDGLSVRREIGIPTGIAHSLNNIGDLFLARLQAQKALDHFKEALAMNAMEEDKLNYNIGRCYYELGNYKEAEICYKKAVTINETTTKDQAQLTSIYAALGKIYLKQDKFKCSEKYLEKSLQLSKETGRKEDQLGCLLVFKNLLFAKKKYARAFEYYDLYTKLKEEIFNEKRVESREKMKAAYEIRKKEDEIEYSQRLMQELQHRVKNNLTMLSSMIELQIPALNDKQTTELVLKDICHRIDAMRLVHEQLYKGNNTKKVALEPFVKNLVANIITANQKDIKSKIEQYVYVDYGNLKLKKAIDVALILNELICNAFKYAFPDHPNPILTISLKRNIQTGELQMIVQDNGKGIDLDGMNKKTKGFGLKLNGLLTEQLNGTLKIDPTVKKGTKWVLTFKA